jgi:hypothetical protein
VTSELVIHNIDTGQETLVLSTRAHIEAPNWTRDGAALLVNSDGRLFRVPVSHPEMHPVDTGPLVS